MNCIKWKYYKYETVKWKKLYTTEEWNIVAMNTYAKISHHSINGIPVTEEGCAFTSNQFHIGSQQCEQHLFPSLILAQNWIEKKLEEMIRRELIMLNISIPIILHAHNKGKISGNVLIAWNIIRNMPDIDIKAGDLRRLMGVAPTPYADRPFTDILVNLCRRGYLRRIYVGVYRVENIKVNQDEAV